MRALQSSRKGNETKTTIQIQEVNSHIGVPIRGFVWLYWDKYSENPRGPYLIRDEESGQWEAATFADRLLLKEGSYRVFVVLKPNE